MKCLIAPYMGSGLQPNGLSALPQVWGYIFSPMESSLKGKMKGPKGPFVFKNDECSVDNQCIFRADTSCRDERKPCGFFTLFHHYFWKD